MPHVSRGVVYIERLRRCRVVILADARAVTSLQSGGGHLARLLHEAALQSAVDQCVGCGRTSRASLRSGGVHWRRLLHEAALQSARNQIVIGGRRGRGVPYDRVEIIGGCSTKQPCNLLWISLLMADARAVTSLQFAGDLCVGEGVDGVA